MDEQQALHYAGIIINKLEAYRSRAGGSKKIHDTNSHLAVVEGYKRMLEAKMSGTGYPSPQQSILNWLNSCIEDAERFLSQ
jgi:uncharacterized protein YfbU (UPF0304 family)